MYHIKEDRRARTSVELICAGLLDCLGEKSFRDITISDIQRASTVSRSTFYRNFDSLEDVLGLLCDRVFREAFAVEGGELRVAVFRRWFRDQRLIETIVDIHRTDILFSSLRRCALELESFRLLREADERLYDYIASMIASTMMGIMVVWVERGRRESEAELLELIRGGFAALDALGITGG